MATIKVIPPRGRIPDTLRVAAYCRVSSDSADQKHSYAAQIRAYTEKIGSHEGWELVDVYADEGLTGTRTERREDFNRMLADCRRGKIDRILVKSLSRFSRNTRDCLSALRELTALGVTVCFEKENIDTGTLTTELMVSVSGALAQEESVSISKNQRLSYQRRMERGGVHHLLRTTGLSAGGRKKPGDRRGQGKDCPVDFPAVPCRVQRRLDRRGIKAKTHSKSRRERNMAPPRDHKDPYK